MGRGGGELMPWHLLSPPPLIFFYLFFPRPSSLACKRGGGGRGEKGARRNGARRGGVKASDFPNCGNGRTLKNIIKFMFVYILSITMFHFFISDTVLRLYEYNHKCTFFCDSHVPSSPSSFPCDVLSACRPANKRARATPQPLLL